MSESEKELSNPDGHCVGPSSEMAGKADSCKGCPNAAICASAPKGPDPDLPLIRQRMAGIKHKILVLSGKGGVGKSTVTKELAVALGKRENKLVGVVDADICGPSLPRVMGVRGEEMHTSAGGWEPISVDENVSLISMHFLLKDKNEAIVWRGPKKNSMIKNFLKEVAWGELDVMLVDTPPGTSDEHLSIVNFLKECGGVDGAVIVTTPQDVAVADVRREINFCQKTGIRILGFVENMTRFQCPNCKKTSIIFPSADGSSAAEKLSREFGPPVLGSIPLDPALMQACEEGRSVFEAPEEEATDEDAAPSQSGALSPAAEAFEGIVKALLAAL